MSNANAIASVTSTLRRLIARGVPELPNENVTTRPLDRARANNANSDQLNLFLYHTTVNAAWRNADLPRQTGRGDVGHPPLPLTLHYLITAFGQDDDEIRSHRWLGGAMRALHDHPLLGAGEIQDANVESGLQSQVERVRITLQPMTLDEMSKLWTTFQTQYRVSAAYQLDVVLIESTRDARAALPVLRRGRDDEGVTSVPGNDIPEIDRIDLPERQSSVRLGETLVIVGRHFQDVTGVRFRVISPQAADVLPLTLIAPAVQVVSSTELRVTLPDDAAARTTWRAGIHGVAVLVSRRERIWSSNEVPVAIAPRIETIAPPNPVTRDVQGNVTLTLTCSPEIRLAPINDLVRFDQQVALLVDAVHQIAPLPPPPPPLAPAIPPASTNTVSFTFPVSDDELGEHLVRLRVDGVDLPLVDRSVTPPEFDARQKVRFQ